MTAHDWKPISDTYAAKQCATCGVIRITMDRETGGTVTRYSRPGANSKHCNTWYQNEPSCLDSEKQEAHA